MRRLTTKANADMMSDMKTFTVRELDREPSRVLDTCDAEGAVRIRRRDGRTYVMEANHARTTSVPVSDLLARHRARIKGIFPEPLTKKQTRAVDRMIRGE